MRKANLVLTLLFDSGEVHPVQMERINQYSEFKEKFLKALLSSNRMVIVSEDTLINPHNVVGFYVVHPSLTTQYSVLVSLKHFGYDFYIPTKGRNFWLNLEFPQTPNCYTFIQIPQSPEFSAVLKPDYIQYIQKVRKEEEDD